MKRWRFVPLVLVTAVALWACEPVEPGPGEDPLPPIEDDFGDTGDDVGDNDTEP